ncbi:MAG TPA: FAD-dependent oxidoreductase [Desulfomonilaceae bacterium]|nr:FAD-dependent oxidoreductase [Desulfomonilaceae bacterium]
MTCKNLVTNEQPSTEKRAGGVVYSADPADFAYARVNIPCQEACPAYTDIPAYIRCAYERRYGRSYEINRSVNLFPGVLGRICSRPCESKCRHGERELGDPVGICHIKRAASDFKGPGRIHGETIASSPGKTVCVIGAGPAGLAAAHDLSTIGFDVTVLEAFDEPGGMLRYGIPEFRLPRNVLKQEIDTILRFGVKLRTGIRVGTDVAMEELLFRFDAVLVAAGCYVSRKLDVPGENLPGVSSGLAFVVDANARRAPVIGDDVLVIGAGFSAFDCARSALRLGARNVSLCIRATEEDLRVTEDEIFETKREGITIRSLVVSRRILGNGKVEGVEFLRTGPGDRLPNGRRHITPIEGSEFVIPADSVIVAIGQGAEPIPSPGETDRRGVLTADPGTFRTSVRQLYAAGDFMTGPTTVIESIAAGRRAAEQIARDLTGKRFREWAIRIEEARLTDRERSWDFIPRVEMPAVLPVQDRLHPPDRQVEIGFSDEEAFEEAKRCYLCYLHYEIDIDRCIYCRYCIDVAPRDCIKLVQEVVTDEQGAITGFVETNEWGRVSAVAIDNSRCIRCGACVRVCPMDCISVSKVQKVERLLHPWGDT